MVPSNNNVLVCYTDYVVTVFVWQTTIRNCERIVVFDRLNSSLVDDLEIFWKERKECQISMFYFPV